MAAVVGWTDGPEVMDRLALQAGAVVTRKDWAVVDRSASTLSAARVRAAMVEAGPLATSAADVAVAVAADAVVAAVAPAATQPYNVAPSPDWQLANSLLPYPQTPSE